MPQNSQKGPLAVSFKLSSNAGYEAEVDAIRLAFESLEDTARGQGLDVSFGPAFVGDLGDHKELVILGQRTNRAAEFTALAARAMPGHACTVEEGYDMHSKPPVVHVIRDYHLS